MNLSKLWRQTPIRFAVIFAVMFLAIVAVAGATAVVRINRELNEVLDARVLERYRSIEAVYQSGGLEELIAQVNQRSIGMPHEVGFVSLTTMDHQRLAGAAQTGVVVDGLQTLTPKQFIGSPAQIIAHQQSDDRDDDDSFRIMAGPVGNARLIVASGLEELEETREVLIGSFLLAALLILLLSVLGGYFVTRQLQRRFDSLTVALRNVSSGELSTRLPTSGRDDDIDGFLGSINQTFDRLQRLVEGMQQVSTDIAHDLKTPLGRLLINAERGLSDSTLSASSQAAFVEIRDEADQINQTFEALLRVAQIQSGVAKQRFAPVDLGALLADMTETYQPVAQQLGFSLSMNVGDSERQQERGLVILGDKVLLTQLLSNLIENSLNHSETGTLVLADVFHEAPHVVVSLSDNGSGIPEEERARVFRRLYRLEKSRNTPGTGLGLNLVQAIVELHDAQISLHDNAPGLKTLIRFPVIDAASGIDPTEQATTSRP